MLHLHLTDGATHETDPASADHYQISTFDQTDIPIPIPQTDNQDQEPVPAAQMPTWDLRDQAAQGQEVCGSLVSTSSSIAVLLCPPHAWCWRW